jgi:hypothetical protein
VGDGTLREYLVKGFTMDDERLKNPPGPGHRSRSTSGPEELQVIGP